MSAPFVHQRRIRFSHCDPAGILYFPHVFDFLNAAVEDWFETGLGMPFGEFHMRHRMGNPVVTTDGRFSRALRFGERIALAVHVSRLLAYCTAAANPVERGQILFTPPVAEIESRKLSFGRRGHEPD